MKKYCSVLLLFVMFICCSCSIQSEYPHEGIYYCDQLKMTIDFSKLGYENGVEVVLDDGNIAFFVCQIGYGSEVLIIDSEKADFYLMGHFKYKDDIFYIKTEDETYQLLRIQE